MMNKNAGVLLVALVAINGLKSSYAFQVYRQSAIPSKFFGQTDPSREIDIDLDIAEDCATNFGKYSFEEIEQCREELHARRVQHVAFGETMSSPNVMKERFLEDELSLQLGWLKSEMPESYLFPDEESFDSNIDTDIDIGDLLMDNGVMAMDLPTRQDTEPSSVAMLEELAKEGVLESVVICAFLGVVMVAPRFF